MAEQRGHFCSQWVGAGWVCNTVSAARGGAGGKRRSVITAQRFPLVFFCLFLPLPNKIEQEALWFQMILRKLMHFSRKQIHSQARKAGVGGRASVCRGLPCLWFTLYSECVSVGDWTPTLPWDGLFTAAVNPFHSSSCSVRDEAPGSPFAAFKWCSAKASHERPDVTAQESDLQAQYLPEFTFSYHPPRSTKIVGRAHLSTISQCYT